MKITAKDVLRKQAAPPMGGVPTQRPTGRPELSSPAPGGPTDPSQMGEAPGAGGDPSQMGAQPEQQNPQQGELAQITQSLLRDYFDDAKISDASDKIQKMIPLVGPEHAEKFVKVYTDWVKAAMTMKANLMAMVVMATPQQLMQNQVQTLMQQLQSGQQQGPQALKSGPLT